MSLKTPEVEEQEYIGNGMTYMKVPQYIVSVSLHGRNKDKIALFCESNPHHEALGQMIVMFPSKEEAYEFSERVKNGGI